MASRNVIERIVRLVFDRGAARKAEQDAERTVSNMDRALGKLRGAALALGSAIAAAFAIGRIVAFGRSSVQAAVEAERSWNRLSGTLRTVGIEFGTVERSIKAAARAMQDTTTLGDEDFAEVLSDLVQITGDYSASLNAVETAADVAAAKQIDLASAARLVGLAIIGETSQFKRMGIVLRENETAMDALRRMFGGMAQNEAQTLSGRVRMLQNEWGDLKEAFGEAIVGGDDVGTTLNGLIDVVKDLTRWVEENEGAIRSWVGWLGKAAMSVGNLLADWTRILDPVGADAMQQITSIRAQGNANDPAFLRVRLAQAERELADLEADIERRRIAAAAADRRFGTLGAPIIEELGLIDTGRDGIDGLRQQAETTRRVIQFLREDIERVGQAATTVGGGGGGGDPEDRAKALADEIKLLTQGHEMQALTSAEIDRAAMLEEQLRQRWAFGNTTLAERLTLVQQINSLAEISGRRPIGDQGMLGSMLPLALPDPASSLPGGRTPEVGSPQPIGAYGGFRSDVVAQVRAQREAVEAEMEKAAQAAQHMGTAIAGGMDVFFSTLIEGFEDGAISARTFAEAFTGIGKFIVAQMIEGWAQKEMAEGTAALAASLWPVPNPAAALSAAKHFAAAGLFTALGSALRSGGRGSGAVGVGAAGVGSTPQNTPQPIGPEIHIHFAGPKVFNPRFEDAMYTAVENARERFGGSRVIYHEGR